ncbi:uncharacterized protein [Setaria viridis]|uniref:uncharacterized protein isoform X2 n=1 Tax=Setaria viridis TaxID=4556 RepID=UPI0003513348
MIFVCVLSVYFPRFIFKVICNIQMNDDVLGVICSLIMFLGFLSYNTMVSRPVVLVFLLVILIVTSQFEWKQQLVNELESTTRNHQHISSREELVKDKIILSQEKMIQKLNDFIQNLQQQLVQCRENNKTIHSSGTSLTSYISEIQRHQMMDD